MSSDFQGKILLSLKSPDLSNIKCLPTGKGWAVIFESIPSARTMSWGSWMVYSHISQLRFLDFLVVLCKGLVQWWGNRCSQGAALRFSQVAVPPFIVKAAGALQKSMGWVGWSWTQLWDGSFSWAFCWTSRVSSTIHQSVPKPPQTANFPMDSSLRCGEDRTWNDLKLE